MRSLTHFGLLSTSIATGFSLASPIPATAGTIRTVALSEQQAPGVESGVNWQGFSFAAINNAGETAFAGFLAGVGNGSASRGIWSEGGGAGLRLVARGQTISAGAIEAPGTQDAYFSSFQDPVINDAGQTVFRAILIGPGANDGPANGKPSNQIGIWSEGGGAGLALAARDGDPAPGAATGEVFSGLSLQPLFDDAGGTGFLGSAGSGLSGGIPGIWSGVGGADLILVARGGEPAPGTPSGVNFALNGFFEPVLNGQGQIAFWGFLTGTGVDSSNDQGIWTEGGGAGLALVARAGDPAPGLPGVSFRSFTSPGPVLNDAGQTAFGATLVDAGSQAFSIWSNGGGAGLALVARAGDAAPGTPSGVNFRVFGSRAPVLNGAGKTAFSALLEGPGVDTSNDFGIWSEGAGAGLALVAREGDAAPGLADGATFFGFRDPLINGAGQTAFWATAGFLDSVDTAEGFPWPGIWVEHPSGRLELVARETDPFDVDDGPGTEFRTIRRLGLVLVPATGNEDGRKGGFNDRGQLAFKAQFTDRSEGIFVFNPDPSLTITSPSDGAGIDADQVLVEGVATDDGQVVSVSVNGVAADLVSTENPNDPAEVLFSALVPLGPGNNPITAVATDDDGNTTTADISIENVPTAEPLLCDANGDGSVDMLDIGAIFGARGSPASGPDDPRDINRDGLITINDGRLCVLQCTNPRCAPSTP